MNKLHKQQGSVHVIITVILVIALLGTLGFVFWQNFLNKAADDSSSSVKTQETTSETTKKFVSSKVGVTFEYPAKWSVKEDYSGYDLNGLKTIDIKVLNEDGMIVASVASDFEGGFTCENPSQDSKIKIVESDVTKLDIKYADSAYYAAEIVNNNEGTYTLYSGIKSTASAGTTAWDCSDTYSAADFTYGVKLDGSGSLIPSITFRSADTKGFQSLSDAQKYLTTDTYKQIRDMIESVNLQ